MFAWIHHLIDEGYFTSIEMFFLFAGHTHSPIDQNFSVVGRAIARAAFIGSPIAMQELFKVAHDITNEKSKASRITEVVVMHIYHDYVSKYNPVLNPLVRNYGGPHRFITAMNNRWGVSDVRYMWQSPETGFRNVWLPMQPPLEQDHEEAVIDIELNQFDSLGGYDHVLEKLNLNAGQRVGEILSSTSSKTAAKNVDKMKAIAEARPVIETLENHSLVAQQVIYDQEASLGKGCSIDPKVKKKLPKLPKNMLAAVEEQMLKTNTKSAGYVRFIKRSLCNDPEWLNKRPDVLPNPKFWRDTLISRNPPPPVESISSEATKVKEKIIICRSLQILK